MRELKFRAWEYRYSPKGVLTRLYSKMKERSRNKCMPPPSFTLDDLHHKYLNDSKYLSAHARWLLSGRESALKPSVDRIDCTKPYTADNIQMITWRENRDKGDREAIRTRRSEVVEVSHSGDVIAVYPSVTEAAEATGCGQNLISMVCAGVRGHTHGRVFRYGGKTRCRKSSIHENPELLEEK